MDVENKKKLVTILVPAYNEHEVLPLLYDRLLHLMELESKYDFEILFVNDGSKDNTRKFDSKIKRKTL